jgi:hypothetical protein
MVHARDAHGHWFVNIIFVRDPPNHQDIALYLMMIDERFPNSLLSVGLFHRRIYSKNEA